MDGMTGSCPVTPARPSPPVVRHLGGRLRPRLAAALALAVAGPAVAGDRHAPSPEELAAAVRADAIRRHTAVLGSDAFEGRWPGSPGGDRAAAYIADQLGRARVEPLGDGGGFHQGVPLHGATPLPDSRLELWRHGDLRQLELGADYLLLTTGSQAEVPRRMRMAFAGWGIVAPEFDHNDYADLDVEGAIVVCLDGEPPSDDPDYFDGPHPTVHGSFEAKWRTALSRGAYGTLVVPDLGPAPEYEWDRRRRIYALEDLSLPYDVASHFAAVLHPRWLGWLLETALYDRSQLEEMQASNTVRPFYLPVSLSFDGRFRERDLMASNVVGVLRGRHHRMDDTAVVVSAHWDHLGTAAPVDGDGIYNGVVDNAIGVAGVLEMARVLGEAGWRPRRSVVFLLTTAEEEGLLGARYFLDHPTWPVADQVANVNVDGLAFQAPFADLVAIGGELSDLGGRLRRAVAPLGLEVAHPPDAMWTQEAYGRSDQLAFAQAGVPSILVSEGFHWPGRTREEALESSIRWMLTRYHTPRDDLSQPIDWDAARLHAAAVLALVVEVADSPVAPEWRPGVRWAYRRLLSLADDR